MKKDGCDTSEIEAKCEELNSIVEQSKELTAKLNIEKQYQQKYKMVKFFGAKLQFSPILILNLF
jgi:hypothetical protein